LLTADHVDIAIWPEGRRRVRAINDVSFGVGQRYSVWLEESGKSTIARAVAEKRSGSTMVTLVSRRTGHRDRSKRSLDEIKQLNGVPKPESSTEPPGKQCAKRWPRTVQALTPRAPELHQR